MSSDQPYNIHLDIKYKPLELIDIDKLVDAVTDPWYNSKDTR
jgi:hypothetical protein